MHEQRSEANATEALYAIARELGKVAESIRDATTTQGLQFKWMVQLAHLATKTDLETQTERVLAAIKATNNGEISPEDKAALDTLLQRSERFTSKLEALDKKTP